MARGDRMAPCHTLHRRQTHGSQHDAQHIHAHFRIYQHVKVVILDMPRNFARSLAGQFHIASGSLLNFTRHSILLMASVVNKGFKAPRSSIVTQLLKYEPTVHSRNKLDRKPILQAAFMGSMSSGSGLRNSGAAADKASATKAAYSDCSCLSFIP